MGDRVDLPTDDKEELQQRRLHKKSQPLEQLDRVIEEIKEVDVEVSRSSQQRELNRREPAIAAGKKRRRKRRSNNNIAGEEQEDNSRREFGIQEDFNTGEEELMRRSSCFS
jgi:hypothetical protein